MIEQSWLNEAFDWIELWMIETSDLQIRKMRERIEENMHDNKNNDLKDSKIITCKDDWIADHELHQQTKNEQWHKWEIIQCETDDKNNDQVQQSMNKNDELHLKNAWTK